MILVLTCGMITVAVGIVAAVRERNPLVPAAFFALLWAGYTTVTVWFFAPDARPYAPAMIWIVVATAAVVLGSVTGRPHIPERKTPGDHPFPALTLITLIFTLACVAEVGIIARQGGYNLRSILSYAVITQLTSLNRSTFGYGDLEQGFVERLLFIAVYAAPLFGGVLLAARRSLFDVALALSAFLLGVAIPALYGSRMGVLWGGSFALSSYLSTVLYLRRPGAALASTLMMRIVAVAVVVLLGVSVATMIVRYAFAESSRSIYLMIADPFSFFAAFAFWFPEGGMRFSDLLMGYRNWENISLLLGIRVGDASEIIVDWPTRDVGFTTSNIYTLFRFLIEDYGTVGALVWLGGFGAISARAFRAAVSGSRAAIPVATFSYAFIFTSFSMSLTYYTTVVAAGVCFAAYFMSLELRNVPFSQRTSASPLANVEG